MLKGEFDSGVTLFHNGIDQRKASLMLLLWQPIKGFRYGGTTSWRKCLPMDARLLFLRIGSSNILIMWGLETTGSRASACNFM